MTIEGEAEKREEPNEELDEFFLDKCMPGAYYENVF